MRKYLVTPFFLLMSLTSFPQSFFESGYRLEFGNEIEQTTDGGFILCGQTFDSLLQDTYKGLLKTDSFGHVQWHKEYVSGHSSLFYSVEQTSDGGYIATGNVGNYDPNTDSIAVIKTDAYGDVQWSKAFGNLTSHSFPSYIKQTLDGNYAVVGMDNYTGDSRVGLYQVDQNGNLIRAVFYKDTLMFSLGLPLDIVQLQDSGFLISGKPTIGGGGYILKTDSTGNVLWSKTFGSNQILIHDISIQQTNDNGFVFAFSASDNISIIVKTDFNGDTTWTRMINGSKPVTSHSIIQLIDSGYLITGSFGNSSTDTLDIFILKLDVNGDFIWSKCIQHPSFDDINAHQVIYNSDNSLSFLTANGFYTGMIKTDTNAFSICNEYQGSIFSVASPIDVVTNSIAQYTGGTSTSLPLNVQVADTNYSIICTSSTSVYMPMLDSVNVWTYTANYMVVAPPPHLVQVFNCTYPQFVNSNGSHITAEDTILHSISYKTLYYNSSFSQCLFGFIREDTAERKIYFQDVVDSPEVVLYDFSMLPGDSININFISNSWNSYWPTGWYRLDSITIVSTISGDRNAFHLNCISQASNHTLTWIEGIGNLADLVYPYSSNSGDMLFSLYGCTEFPHDFVQFLTCFEHQDKVYFDSCAYQVAVNDWCFNVQDSCNYWNICGDVNELNASESIHVYPNPAGDFLSVKNPIPGHPLVFTIYNSLGEKVLVIDQKENQNNTADFSFDVSGLDKGIYFIEAITASKIYKNRFVKE